MHMLAPYCTPGDGETGPGNPESSDKDNREIQKRCKSLGMTNNCTSNQYYLFVFVFYISARASLIVYIFLCLFVID